MCEREYRLIWRQVLEKKYRQRISIRCCEGDLCNAATPAVSMLKPAVLVLCLVGAAAGSGLLSYLLLDAVRWRRKRAAARPQVVAAAATSQQQARVGSGQQVATVPLNMTNGHLQTTMQQQHYHHQQGSLIVAS